jgi:uncharacterized protein (DUF2141 family)
VIVAALLAAAALRSVPTLGMAEGRCRPDEPGPALIVTLAGLKDRAGLVRAELYPDNDTDFLADDNVLIGAGKTFRRVERSVPSAGPVELCLRVPAPGSYALSVLHDRDGNRKFGMASDGVGFAGNPRLGWHKPRAADATVHAGPGLTRLTVRMNYRRGLLSFGPLDGDRP